MRDDVIRLVESYIDAVRRNDADAPSLSIPTSYLKAR